MDQEAEEKVVGTDCGADAPASPGGEVTFKSIAATVAAYFRRLGPAGPLAIVAASTPAISGFLLLGSIHWVAPWLKAHPGLGLLLYVAVYFVLGGLALMPTYAYSVLGGWSFGFRAGFPAAVSAFTAASVLGYIIGRYASGRRVTDIIEEHPKSKAVYDALIGSGFGKSLLVITLLRLPPSSPFAITNLTMAAMRVHPLAYVIGTLVGIAPRTAAVVFVAAGAAQLTFDQPRDTWMLAASIVVTVVVLGILGALANRAVARVTAAPASNR